MSQPVIADNKPQKVRLEKGKEYAWCVCGRSDDQPFCDGSHQGTGFSPKVFVAEADDDAVLCQCKQTGDAPFCDGTHQHFGKELVGKEAPESASTEGGEGPEKAPKAKNTEEEPTVEFIHQLAREGLEGVGRHGPITAMGVPRHTLPHWDDLQLMVAQLATQPLLDDAEVATRLVVGPEAKKPLTLEMPLLVSDMSFGALSEEAKIARVRGLAEGEPGQSPATFTDLHEVADFRRFADRVREITGGIPVGFKLSANHIERDIQFALDAGADYLILDGRGGATGAAPAMFRDHISVPTIPALARARRYLDAQGASGRVTLIVTGGLRLPIDFVKALALGADGVALANSAMQSIGCVSARICNTNNCPAGIATQRQDLRQRLDIDKSAGQLDTFLRASLGLMQMMARACGHDSLAKLNPDDLATWDREMALLSGVRYAGVMGPAP